MPLKDSEGHGGLINLLNGDWWYSNNSLITKPIITETGIKILSNRQMYLSYGENNCDFSIYPKKSLHLPKENLTCTLRGDILGNLTVNLMVIGYKNYKKVKVFKVPINKEVLINLTKVDIDHFRIAINLKGKGELLLKEVKLGNLYILASPFINPQVPKKLWLKHPLASNIEKNTIILEPQNIFLQSVDEKYFEIYKDSITSKLPDRRFSYLSIDESPNLYSPPIQEHTIGPNPSDIYYIELQAQKEASLEMDLIIIGFLESDPVELKCIPFGKKELIIFKTNVDKLKFLIRLRGKGIFSNVKININKEPQKPINVYEIELNSNKWFNPSPTNIKFLQKSNSLKIDTHIEKEKRFYLSYKASDNSFSKVPDQTIFEINPKNYYEIVVKGDNRTNGTVSPVIIGYSAHEKIEIFNLELNKINHIHFNQKVIKCRVSILTSGINDVEIRSFMIKEFEEIKSGGEIESEEVKLFKALGLQEKKLSKVKVAAIFDEFTTACFEPECDLITFTPENWREKLMTENPDFLMVESAWRGNNGSWTKKIQYISDKAIQDLKELIKWCNENNILTVFWNKEDPVHYQHFIKTAKLFDYVFTTDSNMIANYKRDCGHNRVDVLQFAAQPLIHNPITIGPREKALSFAGSYYNHHPERCRDMLKIFNQAIPYGLVIYDRNYEKTKKGLLQNNRFPQDLTPYIRGNLKYYEIEKAYKGFWAMINVNTVKNSPTMFARRVFEGLACGTPIISTYSKGVESLFGDIICVSENEEEIANVLENLFKDETRYQQVVVEGIRRVLNNHTYTHRLEKITNSLGLRYKLLEKSVTVFAESTTIYSAKKMIEAYKNQDYNYKKLCLITDSKVKEKLDADSSDIFILTPEEFVSSYQNILEFTEDSYLAFMTSDLVYSKNHLLDLMLATKYAPWEIICSESNKDLKFEQVTNFKKYQSIFKRNLFSIYSPEEFIRFLDEQSFGIEQFFKRGARVLAITTK